MSKFKVGDKVRVIEHLGFRDTYIVDQMDHEGLSIVGDDDMSIYFYNNEVELVTEDVDASEGDIVSEKYKYIGTTTKFFTKDNVYEVSDNYNDSFKRDDVGSNHGFDEPWLSENFVKVTEESESLPDTQKASDRQEVRGRNVGSSNYAKFKIQPWDIWLEYDLNPWDADIIKRVLRTKKEDVETLDYEKIIHICEERIRQLND